MADFKNKDFIDSYEELLELTRTLTNKWDPTTSSEADPGVVTLKLMAMLDDRQNYKKDIAESQAYPDTVFDRQTAFDLLQMLGYVLKEQKSAVGYVEAKKVVPAETAIILPAFTPITNADKTLYYFTVADTIFENLAQAPDTKTKNVRVMEGSPFAIEKEGIDEFTIKDIDESGRFFLQKSGLAVNGVFIGIKELDTNNEVVYNYSKWQNVESSVLYPKGLFFFVLSNTEGENYIKFPSNFVELIGDDVFKVQATYSAGGDGNCLKGTLTNLQGSDDLEGFIIRQYFDITTGENQETIKQGFQNYYNSMEIFNTIVTAFDLNSAIKVALNTGTVSSSITAQRMFSNSYSRTAIDRQQKIIANYNGQPYPHYTFDTSEPDRQVDVLCLKPTVEYENGFEIVAEDSTIESEIKSQLDAAKTLAADIHLSEDNYVRADADISGVVYTNIDTKAQANEILSNIKTALKSKYRAENLTFGKQLDQQEVMETIQKADARILNSAISPITYNLRKASRSGSETVLSSLSNTDKIDIAAKSVVEGSVPLYKFSNRSNSEDITNLNPGYVNSGFAMQNYKQLGVSSGVQQEINPVVSSFDNGKTYFNSNSGILPTQLLQFIKPLYRAEIDYGYGMKYYFYSPTTSVISITSDSTLLKGCIIKTGSKIVLSKDSETSVGIIGSIGTSVVPNNNKFYRSSTNDPWICNSIPSDYSVLEQVIVLANSTLAIGSVITQSSSINGSNWSSNVILDGETRMLVGDERLEIWSNSNPTHEIYSAGQVIQANGLILTNNLATGDILSTTQTISIMSTDSSTIPQNSNYFIVLNYRDSVTIDTDGYLLEEGEFFAYSNSSLSEYIILGAGTLLKTESGNVPLDNVVNSSVLENVTSEIFKNLDKELIAISNEISSFSSESQVSAGRDFVKNLEASWTSLGANVVKIQPVAVDSTEEQTFSGNDYRARLVLLLETDKNGQILFNIQPDGSVGATTVSLTLTVGSDETTISGDSVATYTGLLCSKYLRVVVSDGISDLLTSGVAKFSAIKYSRPSGVENAEFSPAGLSMDVAAATNNSTPSSTQVYFAVAEGSQDFLVQTNKNSDSTDIEFSLTTDGTTSAGTVTTLVAKDNYYVLKLHLTNAADADKAMVLVIKNHKTTGQQVVLSKLSCISGYSDEVLSEGFTPAAGDIETEIANIDTQSYFDWLNVPTNDFSHPNSAESFFNSEHPWNYKTLPFINFDALDSTLKIMPISGRFKS